MQMFQFFISIQRLKKKIFLAEANLLFLASDKAQMKKNNMSKNVLYFFFFFFFCSYGCCSSDIYPSFLSICCLTFHIVNKRPRASTQ